MGCYQTTQWPTRPIFFRRSGPPAVAARIQIFLPGISSHRPFGGFGRLAASTGAGDAGPGLGSAPGTVGGRPGHSRVKKRAQKEKKGRGLTGPAPSGWPLAGAASGGGGGEKKARAERLQGRNQGASWPNPRPCPPILKASRWAGRLGQKFGFYTNCKARTIPAGRPEAVTEKKAGDWVLVPSWSRVGSRWNVPRLIQDPDLIAERWISSMLPKPGVGSCHDPRNATSANGAGRGFWRGFLGRTCPQHRLLDQDSFEIHRRTNRGFFKGRDRGTSEGRSRRRAFKGNLEDFLTRHVGRAFAARMTGSSPKGRRPFDEDQWAVIRLMPTFRSIKDADGLRPRGRERARRPTSRWPRDWYEKKKKKRWTSGMRQLPAGQHL